MLVVSDTSPLTALLQIGRVSLLATLFERVLAPPAVNFEVGLGICDLAMALGWNKMHP